MTEEKFQKRLSRYKFPCLLTFHEKHEDENWLVTSPDDVKAIFVKKLGQRIKERWISMPDIDISDGIAAFDFLDERRDHEYEGFTFSNPKTINNSK